jgi:hypothetical protein
MKMLAEPPAGSAQKRNPADEDIRPGFTPLGMRMDCGWILVIESLIFNYPRASLGILGKQCSQLVLTVIGATDAFVNGKFAVCHG